MFLTLTGTAAPTSRRTDEEARDDRHARPATTPDVATPARARTLAALHDIWVIARRGLIHMRRQPEALTDATIQPIMFVLLFAYVFGGAIPVPGGGSYREFLMGGIFAQTIVFARVRRGDQLANDRKNGAVDRFRSLPIARGAVLGGHAVANLIKAALPIVAHVDLRPDRRLAHPQRRPRAARAATC